MKSLKEIKCRAYTLTDSRNAIKFGPIKAVSVKHFIQKINNKTVNITQSPLFSDLFLVRYSSRQQFGYWLTSEVN